MAPIGRLQKNPHTEVLRSSEASILEAHGCFSHLETYYVICSLQLVILVPKVSSKSPLRLVI